MDYLETAAAFNPKAAWALTTGKKIAKSKEAAAAAKVIQRMVRSRRNRNSYVNKRREAVGHAVSEIPAKATRLRTDGYQQFTENQLHAVDPLAIDRRDNSALYLLNQRDRDVIYLAGFKFCMTFNVNKGLYLNVALVSAKHRATISDIDWFRNYTGTARAKNFNSTDLTTHERHCLPINTDDYTVHWHQRWIQFGGNASTLPNRNNPTEIQKWVPINRQIRFDSETNTSAETQFRLVWWAGSPGLDQTASQVANPDAFRLDYNIVTVFREPEAVTTLKRRR